MGKGGNISLLLRSVLVPSPPPPPPPLSPPPNRSVSPPLSEKAPVEPDRCFLNQVHPPPFSPLHSETIKPVTRRGGGAGTVCWGTNMASSAAENSPDLHTSAAQPCVTGLL